MHSNAHARTYPHHRPTPLLLLRERIDGDGDGEPAPERPSTPAPAPEPETATDWKCAHEQLLSLGKVRAAHEREVCRWLLAAQRLGVHVRTGYASIGELAERALGLNGRRIEERLRVARALRELRLLDGAFAAGALSWSAVRELTRVATRDTEQAWLDWARGRRARQIEAAVAARKPGDGPRDPSDPTRVKHRLAFEVRAETMALFRDLQSAVREELGGVIDDDTLLHEMVMRALEAPGKRNRPAYQVAVSRCDECGQSRIDAGGSSYVVDDKFARMAAGDAQLVSAEPRDARPAACPTPEVIPHVGAPTSPSIRPDPPGSSRQQGAPPSPPAQPPTSGGSHRARDPRPETAEAIPRPIRRIVMRRDRNRCIVPGCTSHRRLQVHHIDPRAEGGTHDPERLAVLCRAHHTAVHYEVLCIDGTGSGGFVFRHGEGTAYGGDVDVARLDVARKAVSALLHMGFKATEARAHVDKALRAGAPSDWAELVREALRLS